MGRGCRIVSTSTCRLFCCRWLLSSAAWLYSNHSRLACLTISRAVSCLFWKWKLQWVFHICHIKYAVNSNLFIPYVWLLALLCWCLPTSREDCSNECISHFNLFMPSVWLLVLLMSSHQSGVPSASVGFHFYHMLIVTFFNEFSWHIADFINGTLECGTNDYLKD